MNHILTGPDENWQREMEQRIEDRLRRSRKEHAADEARLVLLRQVVITEHAPLAPALLWGVVLTAAIVALIAGGLLLQQML